MTRAAANDLAVARIAACRPAIVEWVTAREALGLQAGELGHAGPPYAPGQQPAGVVLNALAGAAVHEGWAGSLEGATRMVRDGEIRLHANHTLGVVSPMAGVVRPGQRLFRLVDDASGASSFATLAEKGRRVLRFGHYDEEVAAGLRHVELVVGEALARALPRGGLPVLPIVDQALELGDDVHQRNIGGMLGFLARLPGLPAEAQQWLAGHPQHFLNYAMAAAKLALDRAAGVEQSTVVTAISRNGVDCGVQVAGLPGRWFTAPATRPEGGWFDGFDASHTQPDLGDSAIMEAFGMGGCIAHASPQIAAAMQRDWAEAQAAGAAMRGLFRARRREAQPALAGEAGVGLGLDAERVVAAGRPVRIHTGIAHVDGRTGWIGVGVAQAPVECFAAACAALNAASAPRDRPAGATP